MKINEKIIKIRKEKGLSQEEFGNQINVSRQAVSKWETGETTPDIKKIKEIVQKFNVSYEYLLNDETQNQEEKQTEPKNTPTKKSKKKTTLKIALILIAIYGITSIYKFIAFYTFYTKANSFQEENYMISVEIQTNDPSIKTITHTTTKVGNKKLETDLIQEDENSPKSEEGYTKPKNITYTDMNQKICYELTYDAAQNTYIYHDRKEDMINEQEKEELFKNDNLIKTETLANIPSNFKEILLASIDPRYYQVSIINRYYKTLSISNDAKMKIQLNQDYQLEQINIKLENQNKIINTNYSYDYVQDHFQELIDPIQSGEYNIR